MDYNEEHVNNTLTAGVCPDGLKNSMSIKVLICFLVNSFEEPLTQNDITEIIFERSLANYFETCAAFEELLENGFIKCDEETDILSVSLSGKNAAESLLNEVPLTVREKATDALIKRFNRRRHEAETSVTIEEIDDGCQLNCILFGDNSELMTIRLYLPDIKYALAAKERFIDDPEYLYRTVLSHLTDEASLAPDSK